MEVTAKDLLHKLRQANGIDTAPLPPRAAPSAHRCLRMCFTRLSLAQADKAALKRRVYELSAARSVPAFSGAGESAAAAPVLTHLRGRIDHLQALRAGKPPQMADAHALAEKFAEEVTRKARQRDVT